MFSAKLKVKGSTEYRQKKVLDLLEELGLLHVKDTRIGGHLSRGVSGGERKRTSIGVELITNPSLIFLDEPTTGLDSFTATKVAKILKKLAENGRSVVTTIHQPNSDIYQKFIDLALMSNGQILYMNKANKAVNYFKSIGHECGEHENPAEFFMKMMSMETFQHNIDESVHLNEEEISKNPAAVEALYLDRINKLVSNYEKSSLKCDPNKKFDNLADLTNKEIFQLKYRASWCSEFMVLFKRGFMNVIRTPTASFVRALAIIVTSLLIIALYYDLGTTGTEAIQDRNGVLFFITSGIVMSALQNVILCFPEERAVFMREQASSLYRVSTYFCAKFISEAPFSLLFPFLQAIIPYFAIGLNTETSYKFIIHFLGLEAAYFASTGYAFLIGALISNRTVVVTLIPVIMVPLMLLSGFFVNLENISYVAYPFQYISTFKYTFNLLALVKYVISKLNSLKNEYEDNHIMIGGKDYTDIIIDDMGLELSIVECFAALLSLFVLFYFLSFLALKINSRKSS